VGPTLQLYKRLSGQKYQLCYTTQNTNSSYAKLSPLTAYQCFEDILKAVFGCNHINSLNIFVVSICQLPSNYLFSKWTFSLIGAIQNARSNNST